ncbi:MAG: formimidoylglutamase [Deltaproteobacteria bacterium]|nr:formimidoylglutamase [Deltaproteobacteria bacterium]
MKPPSIRPGDSKLFQRVCFWEKGRIPSKSFAIIGVPDDRGVAIGKGRPGAKKGPDAIRKELYKMTLGAKGELEKIRLYDLGNLKIAKTQKETYQKLSDVVFKLLKQDIFPIILGGGHDLSFGSLSGFARQFPKGGIINIDPHLDCRPPERNGKYSSGSAFWQILSTTKFSGKNLCEFGFCTDCNSKKHRDFLKKKRALLVPWPGNFKKTLQKFAENKKAFALSFDIDSVDCTEAPGVSAINPAGFSGREALDFVKLAVKTHKLRLFEVMETNPRFDPDHRTAKLAARLIYELLIDSVK